MNTIKLRIIFLFITASTLTVLGLAENYTRWLFAPVKCYLVNLADNTLEESGKSGDFCVEHIVSPHQAKQGSVTLGVSSRLKDGGHLYTTTTFWIAKELGAENFSDTEGDFTTKQVKLYNQRGYVVFNKEDLLRPDNSAPYSISQYISQCDKLPIFLNGLFMDSKCLTLQKRAWREIQTISPTLFKNKVVPLSKAVVTWISSHPFRVLSAIGLIAAIANFRSLFALPQRRTNCSNKMAIQGNPNRSALVEVNKRIFSFSILTLVVGGAGFLLNNTTYLIPANLLCLNNQDNISNKPERSSSLVDNVCINEILSPYNSFKGQADVGMIITLADSSSIILETVMFIEDSDDFQDVEGDMMHRQISYYDSRGILQRRSSEHISEHLADLIPANEEVEIWKVVKDKLTANNQFTYISAQRVLGRVVEDSLPFMIAACSILYSYYLYLVLTFGPDSPKEEDQE